MLPLRSMQKLTGVHPDLLAVVKRASELASSQGFEFIVTEGLRSKARQEALFHMGRSRVLNSRHLTGHAVDLCPLAPSGAPDWHPSAFPKVETVVRASAAELDVPVEWGGDFPKRFHTDFIDMPHWQLPRSVYADDDTVSLRPLVMEFLRSGRIL